jgi:hypothetical protein
MSGPVYQLPARSTGTALSGFTVTQVALVGTGVGVLAGCAATLGAAGTAVGVTVLICTVLLAVFPVAGEPLYQILPTALGFAVAGRRPRPATAPARRRNRLRDSSGPVLPAWIGQVDLAEASAGCAVATVDGGPPGLVRHRRGGTVTVVLDVRGGPFSLLDPAGQHRQIGGWARVLSQLAREAPVTRLGWTVHSHPGGLDAAGGWTHEPARQPDEPRPVAADVHGMLALVSYRRLLTQTSALLVGHQVRLWLTVDPRRTRRRQINPDGLALAAAEALAGRCQTAGLTVLGLLDAAALADIVTAHADPPKPAVGADGSVGLAIRAGLTGRGRLRPAAGLDLRPYWDAVHIGGTWHRLFWVSQWPPTGLQPGWLDPLLHETPNSARTVAVVMEPVPLRISRRRINSESVSVDTALAMREKHAFRIPVHLARAHEEIDRRDAEIHAGYPEYTYLCLIDVTGVDRAGLDEASADLLDLAARCGITDLRPLHGRHHLAWPATLPFGLAPRRTLTGSS